MFHGQFHRIFFFSPHFHRVFSSAADCMDFRLGRDFVDQKFEIFHFVKRYWPTKSQLIDYRNRPVRHPTTSILAVTHSKRESVR